MSPENDTELICILKTYTYNINLNIDHSANNVILRIFIYLSVHISTYLFMSTYQIMKVNSMY